MSYKIGPRGVEPAAGNGTSAMSTSAESSTAPGISVPIELRSQKMGVLRLYRDAEFGEWTAQDQTLIQDVVEQLALALENARLMEEIRNHARQEELISQIVANTQSSLSLEGVMRTAVQEVVRVLNVSQARLVLGSDENGGSENTGDLDTGGGRL